MEFKRVARSGQVQEGTVRRFFAGEHEFAVARLDGKAYATSNYCTHLDCLLSSGKLVDDGIGCSCHGSAFDLETGEPICPPATKPIKTYPVQERDGEIFVGVEPGDAPGRSPPAGRPEFVMSAAHRPAALSVGGMVSSSHPAASFAGARVLADGGNAIDATLAMAAVTWLTLPGQCGIGGDAFAVVREPDGRVWTINGSGFGPDGGTAQFYRDKSLSSIPLAGALAVAVPGAPAALNALHTHGATIALAELWEPAARLAENGLPCSAKTASDVHEALTPVRADPGLAAVFAPDSAAPRVGTLLRQPDLARSIRLLGRDPGGFYVGELAERGVAALRAGGAPFSGEEWAAGATVEPEPAITGRYAGALVHQTPLPTPGWMVLHQAALCDGVVGSFPMAERRRDRPAGPCRAPVIPGPPRALREPIHRRPRRSRAGPDRGAAPTIGGCNRDPSGVQHACG